MLQKTRELITKWSLAPHSRRNLDDLLSAPPTPEALLRKRLEWLTDLIQWIRSPGVIKTDLDFQSGHPQALRAKYLLFVLERNPAWKKNVAVLLRSIIHDTSALDLFVNAGMANQQGFSGELLERIHYKLLPQAPNYANLASFFSQTFQKEEDYVWISQLDKKVFEDFLNLFSFEDYSAGEWNSLIADAKDAILLLSTQVSGAGLSTAIRSRVTNKNFKQLPFFELPLLAQKMVEVQDSDQRLVLALQLEKLVDRCQLAISEVYTHLNEYGVSINIVFLLDRMESQLRRIRNLIELVLSHERNPEAVSQFVSTLMVENVRLHKFGALFADNLALISKKIVERSAETGEHYITRNRAEYMYILRKAIGGGVLTAITTLVKFLMYKLPASIFFHGFFASLNYSISFVAIQLMGYTLATKQPAMTAPALAAKMHKVNDPEALEKLVDEIIHLMRSQFIAVLGNIYAVVPTMILISFAWFFALHHHLLPADKAHHTIESLSILGGMIPYAAFTGILLWVSSVMAGWVDNWFVYHKMNSAISQNRRMVFVFGEGGAKKIGLFFRKNISGFAGNISLGFFLGLIPVFGTFLGLPIDVRHVTLSSGSLAAAVVSLGHNVFSTWDFWFAVFGILICGFLNVSVAFSMSMFIAIRARKVKTPQRKQIYKAVVMRLKKQPMSLFYPKNTTTDGKNLH
ncbi:site-specific recombinase [Bdellovibrio sp. HCB337]|uniref:site-specific recombinase n=1 Tax=Bdellovibrio sp. HCB337 TaxID=3394358 RepID=UPI0039A72B57